MGKRARDKRIRRELRIDRLMRSLRVSIVESLRDASQREAAFETDTPEWHDAARNAWRWATVPQALPILSITLSLAMGEERADSLLRLKRTVSELAGWLEHNEVELRDAAREEAE